MTRTIISLAVGALCLFLMLPVLTSMYFSWHWEDEATREAIYRESQVILSQMPSDDRQIIPRDHWPKTIAKLKPIYVSVSSGGLRIVMHAGFDETSGYLVNREGSHFTPKNNEEGFYTRLSNGIWWYHYS